MRTFNAIVSGRVQGVGYRYYVQREADRLGIFGTVRNNYDGSVEIFAQGEEETLNEFLGRIRKGPMFTYISDVDVQWDTIKPDEKLKEFRITF